MPTPPDHEHQSRDGKISLPARDIYGVSLSLGSGTPKLVRHRQGSSNLHLVPIQRELQITDSGQSAVQEAQQELFGAVSAVIFYLGSDSYTLSRP